MIVHELTEIIAEVRESEDVANSLTEVVKLIQSRVEPQTAGCVALAPR